VALAFSAPLWSIYALVLALQAGQVVAGPAWQALIPSIADGDEIGRAVSASQAMSTVAAVAAPAAAGLTIGALGYTAPLLADAGTFLVLAVAATHVRARRGAEEAGQAPVEGFEPAELFTLRSDGLLWPLIVGLCVLVLAGEVTNIVEVFLVRGALGASLT